MTRTLNSQASYARQLSPSTLGAERLSRQLRKLRCLTTPSFGLALLALSLSACSKNSHKPQQDESSHKITVLRVESSSPDQAGAEYCQDDGKSCQPLAVSQKLKGGGVVRTFAGGKVRLDLGKGRIIDLDSLSQTRLDQEFAELRSGEISIQTRPLIEKEKAANFRILTTGRQLNVDAAKPTNASFSVRSDETQLTVRNGELLLLPKENAGSQVEKRTRSGQSLRLTSASAFRQRDDGSELPRLLPVVSPSSRQFDSSQPETSRGLGSMSARLPNSTQKRDGVSLVKHTARVVIADGYARTEIEEEFENETPHILEGQYRFPVPGDASLSRLALWVGDTLMEGEVLERTRAAKIYSSIVDRPVPRDPALLEWVSGGEMSLRVFPILPKKTRRVVLAYNQALSAEGGVLRYVYPLSLGAGKENSIREFSIELVAKDSHAELSRPRVQNYDAQISQQGRYLKASFHGQNISPQKDFVMLIDRKVPNTAQLSSYVSAWGPADPQLDFHVSPPSTKKPASTANSLPSHLPPILGQSDQTLTNTSSADLEQNDSAQAVAGFFGLRLSAALPPELSRPAFRALQRAIVMDLSYSQSKASIQAQAELVMGLLREMDPDEEFIILACDSACESFSSQKLGGEQQLSSQPEQSPRLTAASQFMARLAPAGSSDLAGALTAAATHLKFAAAPSSETLRQIVLISDGKVSSGELSAQKIAQRVRGELRAINAQLRIIAAGQAMDLDLLRNLAIQLDGSLDLLPSGLALEQRISELSSILRLDLIHNVHITLPPGLHSTEALALPALYLGQEVLISGQISSMNEGKVQLKGTLGAQNYLLEKELSWQHNRENQNSLLPQLWARARIQQLQGQEESPHIKAEIIDLSQRYQTMSRYTSFLVLESEQMYKDFGVERASKKDESRDQASSFLDDAALQFEEREAQSESKEIGSSFDAEQEKLTAPRRRAGGSHSGATSGAASAPRLAPAPRPAPIQGAAPSPMPKPSPRPASRPEERADAFDDREESASRGATSVKKKTVAPEQLATMPDFEAPVRYHARHHFSFSTADEAWRSWGAELIERSQQSLDRLSQSRTAHETHVRRLLQNGRFHEALGAAKNFLNLDPDHDLALELLAYAAVSDGNHELSRQMLDARLEADPRSLDKHLEAAQAFESVGDRVRACAHFRSAAEISPSSQELSAEAQLCFQELLGKARALDRQAPQGQAGLMEITIECDEGLTQDACPSPMAVAPNGQITSPWTPGRGKSDRQRITLLKLRSGNYFLLLLGGSPEAKGRMLITTRSGQKSFHFEGGALQTIAKSSVSYY